MDEGDPGDRAAIRGRQAKQRIEELRARRERLERGEAVNEQDVAAARGAARLAQQRDMDSSVAAAEGERSAAAAHRKAAEVLEQTGDDDGAARHREQAGEDEASAVADDVTAGQEAQQ